VGYGDEARSVLKHKGGAQYYLPVLHLMEAMADDREAVVVADVRNREAISDLPPDVCGSPHPHSPGSRRTAAGRPPPLTVRGLVQTVKAYEELTVQAAITGDQRAVLAALMENPLAGSNARASAFLDRALDNEQAYTSSSFH
jgi:6-phospho-beta-glucosidase